MAYCNKCGTQIEDSAKFCPKCGNSIRENIVNVSQSGSHANNSDEMSKGQKSGAGCATIIALACIMGGLSERNVFIVIASIAAIGAMIYLFMGKIDKKYTWATIIAAILGVFVVVGATHEETQSTEQVKSEQKEESKTELKAREQKEKADRQAKQKKEEAERKAQDQKEEADRQANEKQEKIKKIADVAYQKGWNERMNRRDFPNPKILAEIEYIKRYGVEPTKSGEEERWGIFEQNYVKGYEAAWEELRKRMHSEDL